MERCTRRQALERIKSLLVAGAAISPATVLAGCTSDSVTFRYKLMLEVEVDGEIKRAFNVVKVTSGFSRLASQYGTAVTGEALVLEVRKNELLVALLGRMWERTAWRNKKKGDWGPDGPGGTLAFAYSEPHKSGEDSHTWLRRLVKHRGQRVIPARALPDLVTFDEMGRPDTVREVDPENLSEVFGSDVRLHRALIEITNEPLTTGIEAKLPWLGPGPMKGYLSGDRRTSSNRLATVLSGDAFRRRGY